MTLVFSFIIAMFVTMVLIPPLMKFAGWSGLLDYPGKRKVHSHAIPRVGGVAMMIGAVAPIIIWLTPDREVISYLFGIGIILMFGVWDDLKNIDYRLKFVGQFAATLVVVFYGNVLITSVPFYDSVQLSSYISIPLTIVFLVGITNAINLADGLDGLAGGTTLLSIGVIAILAYIANGDTVVVISLSVLGCILGFLRFNTYPARIFMGDSGSQFLGFSAGVLAILLSQSVNTAISPVLPILILGLPILDTTMVFSQRIYEKRSPFEADKNHIHHRLLALGFDHYEAVSIIYITQACLVAGAYFMRYQHDMLILGMYMLFCLSVIGFLHWGKVTHWLAHRGHDSSSDTYIFTKIKWLREVKFFSKFTFYFSLVTISAYFLAGALTIEKVTPDITILAGLLLFIAIFTFFMQRHKPLNWIEIGVTFIGSTIVIYQVQTASSILEHIKVYHDLYFVILAIIVLMGFRFSHDRKFIITPLDFLIIFIALIVPNLPGLPMTDANIGISIAKMIVLFYGIVLVFNNITKRWDIVRCSVILILTILVMQGTVFLT